MDGLVTLVLPGLVIGSTGGCAFMYWFASKLEHRVLTLRERVNVVAALVIMGLFVVYLALTPLLTV